MRKNAGGKKRLPQMRQKANAEILRLLALEYPNAKPGLEFKNAFELLIATMLSAQSTDKQVNKATAVMFEKLKTPADYAGLELGELIPYIKSCGFFNTKGKHIIETCKLLEERYGGAVPADRDVLTSLPGVGRKTANVVVSNAFGIPAIAVDTHVFRVANRLGICEAKTVLEAERQLMEAIPEESWSLAHHYLIWHGRNVCSARKPRCTACALAEHCAYGQEVVNVCR